MVAPITLNVRHIRGNTFTVEVDHDADALGLKVVIWEAQQIPVNQQRLVFGGKELEDGNTLYSMGISDGGQIFLVESNDEIAQLDNNNNNNNLNNNNANVNNDNVDVQASAAVVVPPAFAPESDVESSQVVIPTAVAMPSQSGSFAVNLPAPDNRMAYELVSDDEASLERINAAICLAKYVRVYCIFGFILCLLGMLGSTWFAIGVIIYLLGWVGTRKLNRCLLVFPMILTFIEGFGGIAHSIAYVACDDDDDDESEEHSYKWLIFLFCMFLSFLFVMIFASIGKLMRRIRKLSKDEWVNARAKIRQRGCCC